MKRLLILGICLLAMLTGREALASEPVVKTGIEVLRDRGFEELKGRRVGLVTNPSGVDAHLRSTIESCSMLRKSSLWPCTARSMA